jgi:hypothetical protein
MDDLFKCGFAFFREVAPGIIELENRFTGLRLIYNVKTGEKTVGEAAI